MTADLELDVALRDRLARLAEAVPVRSEPGLATVRVMRVHRRKTAIGSLAPILAVVVAGTVLASLIRIGPFVTMTVAPSGPPEPSASAAADNGIYVVNLDAATVDILIDDQYVGSFECGASAEILSGWRRGPPPWHVDVRSAPSGATIRSFSLDGPLPQGIVLRDGAVLRGPWPMSFGPAPAPSCGPETTDRWKGALQGDGSVLSIADDGAFEVRLRSAKASYLAGEPIDIHASIAYVGHSKDLSQTFEDSVFFTGKQLDGANRFDSLALPTVCAPKALRELPIDWPLGIGERHGPDADWVGRIGDGPPTLPEGRWRIHATFLGSIPACPGQEHRLDLSIDVTVLSAADTTTEIFPKPGECSPPPGRACL